jgi:aryl-alcohol dehydrogenase-like predicted oxidoreductase
VSAVLVGVRSVAELDQNVAAFDAPIPDGLWTDLAASA